MRWILLFCLAVLDGFNALMLRDPHDELRRFVFLFVGYVIYMLGIYLIVEILVNKKK